MALKTTYKNDVLSSSMNGKRRYNESTNSDGTKSFVDATVYSQTGDDFGASDINAITTQVNTNTNALNGISFYYSDNHFYATDGTHSKKLGSAEGSATTAQVLEGATFGSEKYDDTATGTMPNNASVSKTFTASTSDQTYTVPEGYHNGGGKVIAKAVTIATPTANQILIGKSVTVKSNGTTLKSVEGTMPNKGAWTSETSGKGSVTIPEGYHDGTGVVSGLASYNEGRNNCVYLVGTGTSFSVKTLCTSLGIDYTTLTASNFIVEPVSIGISSKGGYGLSTYATEEHEVSAGGSSNISKTYDSGTITVSLSTSCSGEQNYGSVTVNTSGSSSVPSFKIYLIVGSIN